MAMDSSLAVPPAELQKDLTTCLTCLVSDPEFVDDLSTIESNYWKWPFSNHLCLLCLITKTGYNGGAIREGKVAEQNSH